MQAPALYIYRWIVGQVQQLQFALQPNKVINHRVLTLTAVIIYM